MTRDCFKGNNLQRNWLTFRFMVKQVMLWVTGFDFQEGKRKLTGTLKNPKNFVRGKNYKAVIVSPPKGFETPSDKISKNS